MRWIYGLWTDLVWFVKGCSRTCWREVVWALNPSDSVVLRHVPAEDVQRVNLPRSRGLVETTALVFQICPTAFIQRPLVHCRGQLGSFKNAVDPQIEISMGKWWSTMILSYLINHDLFLVLYFQPNLIAYDFGDRPGSGLQSAEGDWKMSTCSDVLQQRNGHDMLWSYEQCMHSTSWFNLQECWCAAKTWDNETSWTIEAKHVVVTFSVSYLALLPFVDFIAEVGQSGQTARASAGSAAIVTLSRHPPDLNTWIRPIWPVNLVMGLSMGNRPPQISGQIWPV